MVDIYFTMRADHQKEFLNSITSDVRISIKRAELTVKQREARELQLFMESMTRSRRIAAEKMTEQLKRSLK